MSETKIPLLPPPFESVVPTLQKSEYLDILPTLQSALHSSQSWMEMAHDQNKALRRTEMAIAMAYLAMTLAVGDLDDKTRKGVGRHHTVMRLCGALDEMTQLLFDPLIDRPDDPSGPAVPIDPEKYLSLTVTRYAEQKKAAEKKAELEEKTSSRPDPVQRMKNRPPPPSKQEVEFSVQEDSKPVGVYHGKAVRNRRGRK